MKKYEIQYWEKESVWVRRKTIIESETQPTQQNAQELIETGNCDYIDADYDWETSETLDYDFKTDFKAEEVK